MNKSHAPDKLELTALRDFPLVHAGDKLPELIADSLRTNGLTILDESQFQLPTNSRLDP